MAKKGLIIQGGGFRTAFTAGVLDAFMAFDYNPFNSYYVVSGGGIAGAYFLGKQYKKCLEAVFLLAEDKDFMSYNKLLKGDVLMDIDYFHTIADEKVKFDIDIAMAGLKGKSMSIVMTNIATGLPEYYHPCKETWTDAIISSCTLPFVTKGKHQLNGEEYMDGGWSDPLPIEKAVTDGCEEIVIIRTCPVDLKVKQSWADYFGSFAYRSNANLQSCFENNHTIYNESIDYIANLPKNISVKQIAPLTPLEAGTYSNSRPILIRDYRYGVECGLDFLQEQ